MLTQGSVAVVCKVSGFDPHTRKAGMAFNVRDSGLGSSDYTQTKHIIDIGNTRNNNPVAQEDLPEGSPAQLLHDLQL